MLMNYRCPGCGNTMEFSPSDQKMYCVYCGSSYSTEELNSIIDKTGLYDRINNNAQYQDMLTFGSRLNLICGEDDLSKPQGNVGARGAFLKR